MKRFTLRVAISTLVLGLILASVGSVFGAFTLGARRALTLTTADLMGQMSQGLSDKLGQRLRTVEKLNRLLADLVRRGTMDLGRGDECTDFLRDFLESNPNITLINCGLPSGRMYQAMRMPDGTVSRHLVNRTDREFTSLWMHQNPALEAEFKDRREAAGPDNDFRERTWWKTALQQGRQDWTDLYATRGGLNYSNVNPVLDGQGRLLCVIAVDMRVEDLSRYMVHMKVAGTGKPFILDKDFQVVAMPLAKDGDLGRIVRTTVQDGRKTFSLYPPEAFPDPAVRAAVLALRADPGAGGRRLLEVRDAGGRALLAAFEPEPKSGFTVGVVVPRSEILGPVERTIRVTIALTVLSVVLALVLAALISRAISRPLAVLAGQVDRIRELDFADGEPVRTAITEVRRIDASVQNMRKGLRSFKKYVPSDVVSRLIHLDREAVIEGERRELTLFFSDVKDFTSISEGMGPEALVEMLGSYFEEVTRTLLEGSGTVDKFIGDAVMAFWGAPNPMAGHALAACGAALRAQESIARLNARWEREGRPAFHTRMGIHTGDAIVGNVGFEGRMNYTAIGDSVNLASRLEGLNKFYGTRILVSDATLRAAGAGVVARQVDLVTVKGKDRPVGIFELLALAGDAGEDLKALAARSREAFGLYLERRWDAALALLEGLPGEPARILEARCRALRAEAPGPDWDGVFRHHEK